MALPKELISFIENYVKSNSPKISKLNLSHFKLDDEAANLIHSALQHNRFIIELNYDKSGIKPEIVAAIDSHLANIQKYRKNSYTAQEELLVKKSQQIYRKNRLFRQIESATDLHPEKQSVINVTKILSELYADQEKLLSVQENEARHDEVLTTEENSLIKELAKIAFYLKHATPFYTEIKSTTNSLLSVTERARHKLNAANSHTGALVFRQDNVFFSFGSAQHPIADFIEEHAEVVVEGKLTSEQFVNNFWFGPHGSSMESQAKQFGTTRRLILSDNFENCNIINYVYSNGKIRRRVIKAEHECVTAKHFMQFIGLKLVQELRYIGEPYRSHILKNLTNHSILESAIDNLFNYPLYEIKVPVEVSLVGINIKPLEHAAVDTTKAERAYGFYQALVNGDVRSIEKLLDSGFDVNCKDGNNKTPLLRCLFLLLSAKTVEAKQCYTTITHYLIDRGADMTTGNGVCTPLFYAVSAENIDLVRRILRAYKPVSTSSLVADVANFYMKDVTMDSNIVAEAARKGNLQLVKLLIDNGAIINDRIGLAALMEAIKVGHIELVKYFLQFNLNLNLRVRQLFSLQCPLFLASELNQIEVMQLLIKHGAQVNQYANNETPLICAVRNGHLEATKLLFDNGANLNQQDDSGRSALDFAKNPRIITFLTAHGAKHGVTQNTTNYTSIESGIALISGHDNEGVRRFLVGRKRDSSGHAVGSYLLPGGLKDKEDESALHTAAREGFEESSIPLLQLLKKKKATATHFYHYELLNTRLRANPQPDDTDTKHVTDVYFFDIGSLKGTRAQANDDLADLKWISKDDLSQFDVIPSNRELIIAAENNQSLVASEHYDIAKKVTECLRFERDSGNQLFNAVAARDTKQVAELLNLGVSPDASSDMNVSALTVACFQGDYATASLLLLRGANPNLLGENAKGGYHNYSSPIHAAFYNGNIDIINLILANGGNIQLGNYFNGISPSYLAAKKGNLPLVKYAFSLGYLPNWNGINQDMFSSLANHLVTKNIAEDTVIAILEIFLDKGANVNEKDSFYHETALNWICMEKNNYPKVVKFLLERGANKNLIGNDMKSAMDYAELYNNSYLDLLSEFGCALPLAAR